MTSDTDEPLTPAETERSNRYWDRLRTAVATAGHDGHRFTGEGSSRAGGHFAVMTYWCTDCDELLFASRECQIGRRERCTECEPTLIRRLLRRRT